ncbi:MAG: helix-turn-helix domain-containing protein [Candidatus Thermoplasmatota archaeon]
MSPELRPGEIDCDNVMECLYDLTDLDKKILSVLLEQDELTSSEIAEKIDKDQSTAYRSLEKLFECGLLYKEKETIRNGGYYFQYSLRPLDKIKEEALACVESWYEEMKGSIKEMDSGNL